MKRVRHIRERPNSPVGRDMTKSTAPLNTALPCVIQIQTQCVTSRHPPPPFVHHCTTIAISKMRVSFRVSKSNTKKYVHIYLGTCGLFNPLKPNGYCMRAITCNIQQFHVPPTQWVYVFCVDLRTKSYYFPIQNKLAGFYTRALNLCSTVVTMCTTSLTFNYSTFCPHSVFFGFVLI